MSSNEHTRDSNTLLGPRWHNGIILNFGFFRNGLMTLSSSSEALNVEAVRQTTILKVEQLPRISTTNRANGQ